MKHGADWYKRNPSAYLGGVQGLTTKEHAVYGVIIELIYVHGGSVNNDPGWISGWIKDMGSAACRNTIESLVSRGKLIIEGDQITNKLARNTVKTKENLEEIRQDAGRLGGVNSGKSRRDEQENNDLGKPSASVLLPVDKIREDKKEPKPEIECDILPLNLPDPKPDRSREQELKRQIEDGFTEFWDKIWPSHQRKTGKADCFKVCQSACMGTHPKYDQIAPADLNAATRRYIDSVRDKQFLKGPLPWLRAPGWEPFVRSKSQSTLDMNDPVIRRAMRRIEEEGN